MFLRVSVRSGLRRIWICRIVVLLSEGVVRRAVVPPRLLGRNNIAGRKFGRIRGITDIGTYVALSRFIGEPRAAPEFMVRVDDPWTGGGG
jgi:hypothetical protein